MAPNWLEQAWATLASMPILWAAIHARLHSGLLALLTWHRLQMSVPPFAIGTVAVLVSVLISDRAKDRTIICTLGTAVAMVGLIVMAKTTNNHLRYAFTNICMSGAFLAGPLGLAWLAVSASPHSYNPLCDKKLTADRLCLLPPPSSVQHARTIQACAHHWHQWLEQPRKRHFRPALPGKVQANV